MIMKKIQLKTTLLASAFAVAALGMSSVANALPTGTTFNVGPVGAGCPAYACADLGSTYAGSGVVVSGGAIVDPGVDVSGAAATPGKYFGDAAKVLSYNVTSSKDTPAGATDPIIITNLDGKFDFYWGSIDNGNYLDFYLAGEIFDANTDRYTGTQALALAVAAAIPTGANGRTDAYFTFSGDFDEVRMSYNAVAFEVARAVPEPGTLALLGLGIAGLGAARRRQKS
jgi:hypothetical protein